MYRTYIHTRTRVSQCSHASVGLAQARPNNLLPRQHHCTKEIWVTFLDVALVTGYIYTYIFSWCAISTNSMYQMQFGINTQVTLHEGKLSAIVLVVSPLVSIMIAKLNLSVWVTVILWHVHILLLNILSGYYRMVGNFRERFIFTFFVSQEPFVKLKLQKFRCLRAKWTNGVSIPGLLGTKSWNCHLFCKRF